MCVVFVKFPNFVGGWEMVGYGKLVDEIIVIGIDEK